MIRWYGWIFPGYAFFGSLETSYRRRFAVFQLPERICSRVRVPVSSRRSRPFFARASPSGVMARIYLTVSLSCRIPRLMSSLVFGSEADGFFRAASSASVEAPAVLVTAVPSTFTSPFFRSWPNPILNASCFWRSASCVPGRMKRRSCVSGRPFFA